MSNKLILKYYESIQGLYIYIYIYIYIKKRDYKLHQGNVTLINIVLVDAYFLNLTFEL